MAPNKAGRAVAKALAIDLDYRQRHEPKDAVQSAADSFQSIEVYEEREPTVGEVLRYLVPTGGGILAYIRSLFPFWSWIFHYNWTWMIGDIIAVSTGPYCSHPCPPGCSNHTPRLSRLAKTARRDCGGLVLLRGGEGGVCSSVPFDPSTHGTWQRPLVGETRWRSPVLGR